jgi:aminopeptidase C
VKPQLTFPRADYTERRKIERKKENVLNQNSYETAARSVSTEKKRLRKTLFSFLFLFGGRPSPRINYTERRKTERKQRKMSQIKIH